jgi:microcystin degradation protein MlrC
MNILFAGLFHETHCFVGERTRFADFRVERGDDILRRRGDGSQVDGFLEVAERAGWTVVPSASYTAMPSGIVTADVFESFWRDVAPVAAAAARDGVDGIYLSLHGAMVTEALEDVEGELLARLRAVEGLREIPLFGVFDLHATFTAAMARNANGLVCYRENPHVDARQTAVRAGELLRRSLEGGGLPRMARLNPPIVWPPTGTGTADSPMRDLEALARRIEAEDPDIWAVNVVAGFAFADAHDAGVSFSAVTVGDEARAFAALQRLAEAADSLKLRGYPEEHDPDTVLSGLAAGAASPVLLVEPSDNVAGGAPGDGTGVLRALVRHDVQGGLVVINDPASVAALSGLAPGGRRMLAVGGKGSPLDAGPLPLEVELVSRSDGRFTLEDLNSHLAASQGREIAMGPSAVVRHRGVTILLTSLKTPPFDLGQLRSQGIEPRDCSVIGVKAAVAHRRAYDPIAGASFTVTTPGPCTSDPTRLPYRRIRRPIFPLDREAPPGAPANR